MIQSIQEIIIRSQRNTYLGLLRSHLEVDWEDVPGKQVGEDLDPTFDLLIKLLLMEPVEFEGADKL